MPSAEAHAKYRRMTNLLQRIITVPDSNRLGDNRSRRGGCCAIILIHYYSTTLGLGDAGEKEGAEEGKGDRATPMARGWSLGARPDEQTRWLSIHRANIFTMTRRLTATWDSKHTYRAVPCSPVVQDCNVFYPKTPLLRHGTALLRGTIVYTW